MSPPFRPFSFRFNDLGELARLWFRRAHPKSLVLFLKKATLADFEDIKPGVRLLRARNGALVTIDAVDSAAHSWHVCKSWKLTEISL